MTETETTEKFSIFSYGFRPFFLVAGIYAILPLIPWVLYLTGQFEPTIALQTWHAHEMLFGFVGAGLSGFLLAAIPSWTNTAPLKGNGLRLFVGFWLAGRVAFWLYLFFDHPIFGYLLFLDLLLPIAQTMRITKLFVATNNKRNFIFIGIMTCLGCANLGVILGINGIFDSTYTAGIFASNTMMVAIALIGGRVVPNFTRNYLKAKNSPYIVSSLPVIEKTALLLLVFNALIDLSFPHTTISYTIALLACAVHLLRFSKWGTLKVLDNPIIWVLHLGYLWMIVALFLKGSEAIFDLPYNLYLHAFTVGGIGMFMLGIMSRAALGHTGRPLKIKPVITFAYLMVFSAALIRVSAPFMESYSVTAMTAASNLWVLAYFIFCLVYIPILISPRVDGKPG